MRQGRVLANVCVRGEDLRFSYVHRRSKALVVETRSHGRDDDVSDIIPELQQFQLSRYVTACMAKRAVSLTMGCRDHCPVMTCHESTERGI